MFIKIKKLFFIIKCRSFFLLKAIFYGSAASIEHIDTLSDLDLDFIVDIGANKGQFALLCRYLYPSSRIISFEPLPGPGKVYEKIFSDDRLVKLHQMAIGPDSSKANFHVSNRADSSSLLQISEMQSVTFKGTHEVSTCMVNVEKLSNVISPYQIASKSLLKLDVQGYEYEALIGCKDNIKLFKWIYCECSFVELYVGQKLAYEVIDLLSESGFRIFSVSNLQHNKSGIPIQADFLFLNSYATVG